MTAIQNGKHATLPAHHGFGIVLRALRERAGFSHVELAARVETPRGVGIDHSYISRLETGQRKPTRLTALALARAMRLTPADEAWMVASAGFLPASVSVDALVALVTGGISAPRNDSLVPSRDERPIS